MKLHAFRIVASDGIREYVAADTRDNALRVHRHLSEGTTEELIVDHSERPFFVGMTVALTFEGNHRIGWIDHVKPFCGESQVHIAATPTHPACPLRVQEAGVRTVNGRLP